MKNAFHKVAFLNKLRGQQITKNISDLLIFITLVAVIGTLLGGSLTWIFAIMHPIGKSNIQQETSPFGIYIGNTTSVTSGDLFIDKTISVTREDLQTGRVIWIHNLFKGPHPDMDLVSTVIPAGNTVYALLTQYDSDQHIVTALDTTNGTVRWQYSYPDGAVGMLLYNGTLYVSTFDNNIQTLNASNGKQKTSYHFETSFGGMSIVNGILYITGFTMSDGLSAFNLADGKQIWHTTSIPFIGGMMSSPQVAGGVVYIDVSNENADTSEVVAFDANTGRTLWGAKLSEAAENYIEEVTVARNVVYVGTRDMLFALDADTGKQIWQHASSEGVVAPPTVVDGVVYYAACPGPGFDQLPAKSVALDAATGNEKWETPIAPPITLEGQPITPSVLNGVLYITSGGTSFALNVKDGKQIWKAPKGGTAHSMVVVG